MKKSVLLMTLVLGFMTLSNAQVNERSIGARFGWGGEFSFQEPLTSNTRAEIDLGVYGFGNGSFVLTGIHQWLFPQNDNLNFYAGVGPQVGAYYLSSDSGDHYGLGLAAALQGGIEYNFDELPLQISIDWRPSINIIPTTGAFGYQGLALGVRYRF